MNLNRRGFLRVTGLTALLAAFGIELPEIVKEPPIVIPSTGRIEIQYSTAEQGGRWISFDGPPMPKPLRIRKFQRTLAVSDELILDADFLALPEFRDWLTVHHAVCYAKVTDAETLGVT